MNLLKLLFFFIRVITCGYADENKRLYRVPSDMAQQYIAAMMQCISDAGYGEDVREQILQGNYMDDIRAATALLCAGVKLGTIQENGRLNVDNTMQDLFASEPGTRQVLMECDIARHTSPAETFRGYLLCFRDRAPFTVVF